MALMGSSGVVSADFFPKGLEAFVSMILGKKSNFVFSVFSSRLLFFRFNDFNWWRRVQRPI